MAYDYRKARNLESKAERFLILHRRMVFSDAGKYHTRAIQRIQRLFSAYWRSGVGIMTLTGIALLQW